MSNLPSLYNITSEMLALLESEETTEEQIEIVFGALVEKDCRIAGFRQDLLGQIGAFKNEEMRIAAARKRMESLVSQLEGYIQTSMERLDIPEIKAGTFTIKLAVNPPAVQVEDESLIPSRFFQVTTTTTLNKNAVKEAIKAGEEVPGAKLTQGRSLRIK